ncbi:MAG: FecR domain-containing protein [Gammaproteobacteria bacterium]
MRRVDAPRHSARLLCCWLAVLAALVVPAIAAAQSAVADGEFVYRARARDTLIGVARRLLNEPRRWNEVQARNRIADPRRIPLGTEIRIPYAWLRMAPEVATVSAVSGGVRDATRPLAPGQTLRVGSQIETGPDGSVTLQLADGSEITLQKSSVLRLEEMRRVSGLPATHDTRLKLQSGRLQTGVKPQGDMGRFEIQTPVAVSAVRGTQFRSGFEPDGGNALTETLEGLVAVTGTTTVSLPANFGTRVERNGAPLAPTPLLPPPALQAIPATNGLSQLRLQWPAVAGAAGYRVQLAPDADFHSFFIDAESAAPEVDVPAPADGNYWLRVRSVDRFGLEGQDAVKTLVQRRLPATPALAAPDPGANLFGDGAAFAWTGIEPGVRYRLQIARDAGFTDLLVDRDAGEAMDVGIDRMPPGRYFWRVSGTDERGESGEWSPAQGYTQHPRAPTPHPPEFVARDVQLRWEGEEGVRYHIQVARDPRFGALLLDRTIDRPDLSIPRPRPGKYYARVQTVADDGTIAPYGEIRALEVPVPRWLKILLPLLAVATLIG